MHIDEKLLSMHRLNPMKLFNPTHVKTRQLQLIVELTKSRSILQAAASLGMTQSAASRLLTSLEKEIGVPLFERHARGVVQTEYGEALTRRAVTALAEISRAAADIDELIHGGKVPLSIGCMLSQSSSFLPAALRELNLHAPNIIVHAHIDRSQLLIHGLLHSEYDFVIARVRDASLNPELLFEHVVNEPIAVYARKGHPLARKRKLKLEELATCEWIIPPGESDLRFRINGLCAQNGIPTFSGSLQTLSVPVILSMLSHTDMVVALPIDFAKPFCENKTIAPLPIELGITSDNIGIISRRNQIFSPQLNKALEIFKEMSQKLRLRERT